MRDFLIRLPVFALLALMGLIVWLTHHPEAEILQQAESWPGVGPLATRFRKAYLPPPPPPPGQEANTEDLFEVVLDVPPGPLDLAGPEKRVWVLPGMALKKERDSSSQTLEVIPRATRVIQLTQVGNWFKVKHRGIEGWVHHNTFDPKAERPFGSAPDPPKPLLPKAPDAAQLAMGLELFEGRERELEVGPYRLFTDLRDPAFLSQLDTVASQLDQAYAERYGRQPLGTPRAAILLYAAEAPFRRLQARYDRLSGLHASGFNTSGMAALYRSGRAPSEVAATLIHELAHLVNRRALGPALPPWLDEGLAEDLAFSRIDHENLLHPRKLGGDRQQQGEEIRLRGALASVLQVKERLAAGQLRPLPELLALDWQTFVRGGESRLNYAHGALFIRFLLQGQEGRLASGLHVFLDAIAAGGPATPEALLQHLDKDWRALEGPFRAWLTITAAGIDSP